MKKISQFPLSELVQTLPSDYGEIYNYLRKVIF